MGGAGIEGWGWGSGARVGSRGIGPGGDKKEERLVTEEEGSVAKENLGEGQGWARMEYGWQGWRKGGGKASDGERWMQSGACTRSK